jgi:hypothetical protein
VRSGRRACADETQNACGQAAGLALFVSVLAAGVDDDSLEELLDDVSLVLLVDGAVLDDVASARLSVR